MQKVFISHINEDGPLAQVLSEWIESTFAGHCETFVSSDIEKLPAGNDWLDTLDKALDEASIFIVLCSPSALTRPWISFETGCGWIKKVPVVTICHSGQKMPLPMPLSRFQGLDMEAEDFISDFLKSLREHLHIPKVPRIDQRAMWEEIEQAVGKIGKKSVSANESVDTAQVAQDNQPATAPIPDVRVSISGVMLAPTDDDIVAALSIEVANHSPTDVYYNQVRLELEDGSSFLPVKDYITGLPLLPTVIHPGDKLSMLLDPGALLEKIEDIGRIKRTVAVDKIGRTYFASEEETQAAIRTALRLMKEE